MKSVQKWLVAATAAALASATAVVVAAPASAAPTVPASAITNDPNASNGTLSFYNSAGVQVSSGTNLTHLFDYALASTPAARAHSTKATLYFGFPDHNQSDSQNWVQQQVSASTNYPNAAAPAPLNSEANPMVSVDSTGANYTGAAAGATLDTSPGYAGIVQVRLWDSGPGVPFTPPWWASDIYVDTTAGTWQQVYPQVSGPVATTTVLSASPATTTVGKTTTLTATVSPSDATGSVEFFEGTTSLGSGDVMNGKATLTTSALTVGSHSYTATFTSSATDSFMNSTSQPISVAVTLDKTAISMTPSSTVKYGASVTLHGTISDSTTGAKIAGAAVVLYYRHSTTSAYLPGPSTKSSATGTLALTVKPVSKTYYIWHYAAAGTHAAAASAASTVTVAQTGTIHATPTSVTHGKTLKIWGTIAPSAAGRKITLQRISGGKATNITSTTTKNQKLPNGSTAIGYVFTVTLATKGSFVYRSVVAATTTLAQGISATVTVKAV